MRCHIGGETFIFDTGQVQEHATRGTLLNPLLILTIIQMIISHILMIRDVATTRIRKARTHIVNFFRCAPISHILKDVPPVIMGAELGFVDG